MEHNSPLDECGMSRVHPAKIYCVKGLGSDLPEEKADMQYCSQVIKSASTGMVVLTIYTLIRCDGNTMGFLLKSHNSSLTIRKYESNPNWYHLHNISVFLGIFKVKAKRRG